MIPSAKKKYTVEEYIELLKNSDERFEYFDGEIVSMAGGKFPHNSIGANVVSSISFLLRDRACRTLGADQAIKTVKAPPFRYPDASVVCGEPVVEDIRGVDVLLNPLLIVEVLSKSTEAYDHGEKFIAYQAIESFREYLLISQDRPQVTRYLRQPDDQWLRADISGFESFVKLESLGVVLPLSEIYRMIKFPPESESDGTGVIH